MEPTAFEALVAVLGRVDNLLNEQFDLDKLELMVGWEVRDACREIGFSALRFDEQFDWGTARHGDVATITFNASDGGSVYYILCASDGLLGWAQFRLFKE